MQIPISVQQYQCWGVPETPAKVVEEERRDMAEPFPEETRPHDGTVEPDFHIQKITASTTI